MSEAVTKCFRVEYTGFEDKSCYVAAKSRGSARFVVADSMATNYYADMRKMGACLRKIKSVRRAPEFDHLIDQGRGGPGFMRTEVGEKQ
jgi:hypothetical protein